MGMWVWSLTFTVALHVLKEHAEVWVQADTTSLLPLKNFFEGINLHYEVKTGPGYILEGVTYQEVFTQPANTRKLAPPIACMTPFNLVFYSQHSLEVWLPEYTGITKVNSLTTTESIEGVAYAACRIIYWTRTGLELNFYLISHPEEDFTPSLLRGSPISLYSHNYQITVCEISELLVLFQPDQSDQHRLLLYQFSHISITMLPFPSCNLSLDEVLETACYSDMELLTSKGHITCNRVNCFYISMPSTLGKLLRFRGTGENLEIVAERGTWVKKTNQSYRPLLDRAGDEVIAVDEVVGNFRIAIEREQGHLWLSLTYPEQSLYESHRVRLDWEWQAEVAIRVVRRVDQFFLLVLQDQQRISVFSLCGGDTHLALRGEVGRVQVCAYEGDLPEGSLCVHVEAYADSAAIRVADRAVTSIEQTVYLHEPETHLTWPVHKWAAGSNLQYSLHLQPSSLLISHHILPYYFSKSTSSILFPVQLLTHSNIFLSNNHIIFYNCDTRILNYTDYYNGHSRVHNQTIDNSTILECSINANNDIAVRTEGAILVVINQGAFILHLPFQVLSMVNGKDFLAVITTDGVKVY